MIASKKKISGVILIFIILSVLNQARSQDSLNQLLNNPAQPSQIPQPSLQLPTPPLPSTQPAMKKRFHFFWQNEQKEKYKQELENLKNRQKLETEELKKKQESEKVREVTLQRKLSKSRQKIC